MREVAQKETDSGEKGLMGGGGGRDRQTDRQTDRNIETSKQIQRDKLTEQQKMLSKMLTAIIIL